MGHTDVVPVNPDGWSRDPFAGELVTAADGRAEVWGRGAIDMLNITSSMAVAFRRLADEGFRPRGTLIYFGVADEEAGGDWGARYMVEHHWDAVGADYVLTETGGWSQVGHDGVRRIAVSVAEKGISLAAPAGPRHAGPRLDALRLRQRPRDRGRGRASPGGLSAGTAARRPLAGPRRGDGPARRRARRAHRPGPHRRRDRLARAGAGAHRPRLLAHDGVAERRARRSEDQHHPRRRRHRRRHPHACPARRAPRSRPTSLPRSATSARTST